MAVPRVWAVIVAAGWGERFGGPKQFAELGGARLVDHAVATAAAACDAVVLVVALECPAVAIALRAREHEQEVDEHPHAEPAEGDELQDRGADLPEVEAVGAPEPEQEREDPGCDERAADGLVGRVREAGYRRVLIDAAARHGRDGGRRELGSRVPCSERSCRRGLVDLVVRW